MRVAEEEARGTVSRLGKWVRGDCACGDTGALLYDTDLEGPLVCARCYRVWTREQPEVKQACDSCGSRGNVWRDPVTRKDEYLCVRCHDPAALFQNRWANKVRESHAIHAGAPRAQCGLRNRGTECSGEVKPRGGEFKGMQVCNKHAGKKGSETWRQ